MLIWATEIIGAVFAAFILFVLIMRVIRLDRQASEMYRRRAVSEIDPVEVPRTPADDFHDQVWLPLCDRVAGWAAQRMGRALTEEERRAIWRARSQLVLEVLVKELAGASAGEAMALLRNAPSGLDRPDPTGWCEEQN